MTTSSDDAVSALRDAIERFSRAAPPGGAPWLPRSKGERGLPTQRDDRRWSEFDAQLEGLIAGRRVLIIGPSSDHDAAEFVARGAREVLACQWPEQFGPASGPAHPGWQELAPERHGTFGLVYCRGLLHRVSEPLTLLRALRSVTADDGTLLIGAMMIADPERSEYLRFVPDGYAGDPSLWFLPGRLAFRWLVQAAGFEVDAAFGELDGPRAPIALVSGYLRATAR